MTTKHEHTGDYKRSIDELCQTIDDIKCIRYAMLGTRVGFQQCLSDIGVPACPFTTPEGCHPSDLYDQLRELREDANALRYGPPSAPDVTRLRRRAWQIDDAIAETYLRDVESMNSHLRSHYLTTEED